MIRTTDILILDDGSIGQLIVSDFIQKEALLIKILEDEYGFTTQYRSIIKRSIIIEIVHD